jgi:hypothetical protein
MVVLWFHTTRALSDARDRPFALRARLTSLASRLAPLALAAVIPGCGMSPSPTQPSARAASEPTAFAFEAESGSGDGDLKHRMHASGGLTIHLAPGQRRQWTFTTGAEATRYGVSVMYSNDNPGDTELLNVELDGERIGSFRAQDTGDDGEGWEIFVRDRAGTSMLRSGNHRLVVESTGGDGCIEIDLVIVERS